MNPYLKNYKSKQWIYTVCKASNI